MQTIQHQINTAEAINYQITKLDDEMKYEEESMLAEIEKLNREKSSLKVDAFAKGSFTLFRLIVRTCITLAIVGWGYEKKNEYYYYADFYAQKIGYQLIFGWAALTFIFVLISFFKYRKLKLAKRDAKYRIEEIETKISSIYRTLSKLPEKYQKLKEAIMADFDKIFTDPYQLQQLEHAHLQSDTKECPRCAEIIKAKATYCRFCESELA